MKEAGKTSIPSVAVFAVVARVRVLVARVRALSMERGVRAWLRHNWPLPASVIVWMLACWYAWWVIDPNTRDLRTEWLKTSAQAGGALFLAVGLIYTHRTVENSRRTLEHQQESQRRVLEHQDKIDRNERFFKAAELLSEADNEGAHIGALYALEQLASESDSHYQQVIDVVCAFVRTRSVQLRPSDDRLKWSDLALAPTDIDVAMVVLGRRKYAFGQGEDRNLDLRGAYLCGLKIRNANFQGVDFTDAILYKTQFLRSTLADASLRSCWIVDTVIRDTALLRAFMQGARVKNLELLLSESGKHPRDGIVHPFWVDGRNEWRLEVIERDSRFFDGGEFVADLRWFEADVESVHIYHPRGLSDTIDLSEMLLTDAEMWEKFTVPKNTIPPRYLSQAGR